jgi:hypothetical protein
VAINNSGSPGSDPTRGSGPEKVTEAVTSDYDAPPHATDSEPSDSNEPDPARGGCMRFGWGCLPVVAGLLMLPTAGLLF